ncbi:MAG: AgmX/PglI C-terminal domain-containing protein [Polyangiales bacterium]
MESEERTHYQLAVSGPPVRGEDVETEKTVVEVIVSWGDVRDVLSVTHVSDAGTFVLGDTGETDFLMNAGVLGSSSHTLVENGTLRIPSGASGTLRVAGEERELSDITLAAGIEASLVLGDFRVLVREVQEGKRVAPRQTAMERQPMVFIGGTMAVAGILLGIMALSPAHGMAMTGDRLDTNSRLVNYMTEQAEFEEPEVDFEEEVASGGDEGQRAEGEEGAMGDVESDQQNRSYAIEGNASPEDRALAREHSREEASHAGILGVLPSAMQALNAPTSPFGAEHAIGSDPMSALGAMVGLELGDSEGLGGLGLMSVGRSGGCTGPDCGLATIGLGSEGIGHGLGDCDNGPCLGGGHGPSGTSLGLREHRARVPTIRSTGATVQGALSRETIRRVVRRHHNEVKFCYERALQSNPGLEGRVTTRFMISPSGAVVGSSIVGSTLRHSETESCVRDVLTRFTFPSPDNGGMVSVTYPFTFSAR